MPLWGRGVCHPPFTDQFAARGGCGRKAVPLSRDLAVSGSAATGNDQRRCRYLSRPWNDPRRFSKSCRRRTLRGQAGGKKSSVPCPIGGKELGSRRQPVVSNRTILQISI